MRLDIFTIGAIVIVIMGGYMSFNIFQSWGNTPEQSAIITPTPGPIVATPVPTDAPTPAPVADNTNNTSMPTDTEWIGGTLVLNNVTVDAKMVGQNFYFINGTLIYNVDVIGNLWTPAGMEPGWNVHPTPTPVPPAGRIGYLPDNPTDQWLIEYFGTGQSVEYSRMVYNTYKETIKTQYLDYTLSINIECKEVAVKGQLFEVKANVSNNGPGDCAKSFTAKLTLSYNSHGEYKIIDYTEQPVGIILPRGSTTTPPYRICREIPAYYKPFVGDTMIPVKTGPYELKVELVDPMDGKIVATGRKVVYVTVIGADGMPWMGGDQ